MVDVTLHPGRFGIAGFVDDLQVEHEICALVVDPENCWVLKT
jgi:hypothetical protein